MTNEAKPEDAIPTSEARDQEAAEARAMWAKRWDEGQIGFHEGVPNDLLVKHVARLGAEPSGRARRVLVPLAGKAVDLGWLAERGDEVVGVEFHMGAVRAFFEERGVDPPVVQMGKHASMTSNGVTLVCADMFDVTPAELGKFDVVYDRAALVALEPPTRKRYVDVCRSLLDEGGLTFLIAFSYDQSKAPGPPWSVEEAVVREIYGPSPPSRIEVLETRSVPTSKRLAEAGLTALEESAYLISARGE